MNWTIDQSSMNSNQYRLRRFYDTAGPESGLTTFNIQEHVIASTATELLFEVQSEYKKIYVKPELILRESVRKL